jgi:hypothetical protein
MSIAKRWVAIGAVAAAAAGGMGMNAALASGTTHTLSFKSVQLKSVSPSKTTFVDMDKVVVKGTTIGGDVLSCKLRPTAHDYGCSVSLALKGGQIYGTFAVGGGVDNLHGGKVVGGIGAYKGVTGTITGTNAGHGNENVTVTYHH